MLYTKLRVSFDMVFRSSEVSLTLIRIRDTANTNRTPLEEAELSLLPAKLALDARYNTLVTALATATTPTHLHTISDYNFLFSGKLSQAKKTKGVAPLFTDLQVPVLDITMEKMMLSGMKGMF
jgi:hypothetical protein